ncbi:MAG: hypothetical protein AAGE80_13505 [Pseudomonadota bacterium]
MRIATAAFLTALATPVLAGETIRILPDQAVLACKARTNHALAGRASNTPEPIARFKTDAMENFMFRVKGLYRARIEGADREISVECDVSSEGVEVFTMIIEAPES